MRTYLIATALWIISLPISGQKLELDKASPFTAVKWEKDQPIVEFENNWYHFEKLDDIGKDQIIDYCKKQFGDKWQKRFSEDLVEVLQGLGYRPNVKVRIQLYKEGISKNHIGTFTYRNRQCVHQYNSIAERSSIIQRISMKQALEDLVQFEDILISTSSYVQLSTFDFRAALKKLSVSILGEKGDKNVGELANELGRIMSEIGDRHSSVKSEAFDENGKAIYTLKLPFGVVAIDKKFVATRQNGSDGNYSYYHSSHPNILSIGGISVDELVNIYNYRDKNAPEQAKLARAANAIQNYGELMVNNNHVTTDSVNVVFGDGKSQRTEKFELITAQKGYSSKLLQEHYVDASKVEKGNFDGLGRLVDNSIGYFKIPRMYDFGEVDGLEDFIEKKLEVFSGTKALIIDIRNNPGGTREILRTFARYIVQPQQSPWIANVAYLRTDETIAEDEQSMSGRFLFSYNSKKLTDNDRNAIDRFKNGFKIRDTFDGSRFSTPFYMVLHNGKNPYTKPVYILVNEMSFSAASVFTSAFKSLPNVKIVGETTDGSSGNSRKIYLKHSNIGVRISTMLSFQRDGQTLDGNGTVPDILISADETQVMEGQDNQLLKLIEMINK